MELREYWAIIRKRSLFILFIPLMACIASAYYCLHKTPVYVASTTLLIDEAVASGQGPDPAAYAGIITSQFFTAQLPIADLHVTPRELASTIGLTFNGQSILAVTITSSDQTFAKQLVTAVAHTIVRNGPGVIPGLQAARVLNHATLTPLPLHQTQDISLATGVGLFLGLGLAFLLEYFDMRFKNEGDIVKYLGIPALGSVVDYRGEKRRVRAGKKSTA